MSVDGDSGIAQCCLGTWRNGCASISQGSSAGTGVFCDELFGVRSQGLLGDDSVADYGQNILYISFQITWYLFKIFKFKCTQVQGQRRMSLPKAKEDAVHWGGRVMFIGQAKRTMLLVQPSAPLTRKREYTIAGTRTKGEPESSDSLKVSFLLVRGYAEHPQKQHPEGGKILEFYSFN